MNFLRRVELKREQVMQWEEYPFSLAAVRALYALDLDTPVTYLAGENGAGKSTLLEAIAVAYGFNPEGGSKFLSFATRETHSPLHAHLRLVRSARRATDGYFLRAESFYNVATRIDQLDEEAYMNLGKPIVSSYGGESLHTQSHGEAFFSLFMHRIGGNGLYVLDEPEAALSPMRQLALLARMKALVEKGAQLLISTHSPILLSYPGAQIYWVDEQGIRLTEYEQTEHYQVSRAFLNNTRGMQRMLWEGETEDA